jgi:hypothetical protein
MTPRIHQCKVFWAFLSSSKHSGVREDSKALTLQVLGFTLTLSQSGVATLGAAKIGNGLSFIATTHSQRVTSHVEDERVVENGLSKDLCMGCGFGLC